MIRFKAFGVRFQLPLLTLLMPLLAARLGLRGSIGAVSFALCAHELAHILAARIWGVRISEIQLLPFGGSARIENPYQLPPAKILPVAAAGPAANWLLALLWAFLAQWKLISPDRARTLMQPNLLFMVFNLLPALPLDGGRMLFALLERPIGEEVALKICLWLGRALSAALLICAILGGLRSGCWNLSLILASVMILASARDERSAMGNSRAARLEAQLHSPKNPQPVRFYQIDDRAPLRDALSRLRVREGAWFILLHDGRPQRMLDGGSILAHILNGAEAESPIGDLPSLPRSQLP